MGCSQKEEGPTRTDIAYTIWCEPCAQINLTSVDSPTTPKLKLASCSPWSLNDPLTDWPNDTSNSMTHAFGHASRHWYKYKKTLHCLFTEICTSSWTQAFLAIRSSHQKEEGPKAALTYCFSSSLIPLIQLSNKSSTMPKMQRKKSPAIAKPSLLCTLTPLTPLLIYSFSAVRSFQKLLPHAPNRHSP